MPADSHQKESSDPPPVSAVPGCPEECRGAYESWADASGHLRSAIVCLGQANSVEMDGELLRK